MNEREGFLRAIEADPHDDAVRLVFADWLEDHGDADRARFIRLQCEHHRTYGRLGPAIKSDHRRDLEGEIDSLVKKHRAAWTAGLPAWAQAEPFQRGFLHLFQMTGKQFLDSAAAVRAVAPLDALSLRLLKGRDEAVLANEHLAGVSRLGLDGTQLSDAGIAALTANPHLGRLRLLSAARSTGFDPSNANKLTDVSAVALAEADNLPALTDLDFRGYKKITLPAIQAIVESEKRAGLLAMNLSEGVSGLAIALLFREPRCRLQRLQELRLNDCKLGDDGVKALAEADNLRRLRLLWVTQNKIGDRGAAALASSPILSGLTELDLWTNRLTDAGVRTLLASPHLRALRSLQLGENPGITDESALAILQDGRAWAKVGLDGTQVSPALKAEVAARCRRAAGT